MLSKFKIHRMVLAALFLALAMVLPLLTGQLPQIGNALCPMHIPVLLCGFLCGPWYAMAVCFVAPLLRFLIFGSPVLMPTGISMSFELLTYGVVAAWLYKSFPKKKPYIYSSLITSMLAGRVVWGIARAVLYGLGKAEFASQYSFRVHLSMPFRASSSSSSSSPLSLWHFKSIHPTCIWMQPKAKTNKQQKRKSIIVIESRPFSDCCFHKRLSTSQEKLKKYNKSYCNNNSNMLY